MSSKQPQPNPSTHCKCGGVWKRQTFIGQAHAGSVCNKCGDVGPMRVAIKAARPLAPPSPPRKQYDVARGDVLRMLADSPRTQAALSLSISAELLTKIVQLTRRGFIVHFRSNEHKALIVELHAKDRSESHELDSSVAGLDNEVLRYLELMEDRFAR